MSPSLLVASIFGSSLLDNSQRPDLIVGSAENQALNWTLANNSIPAEELVVTPFESGSVGPNQYHFLFEFAPGALTAPPTLQGWDVYIHKDDKGGIDSLYVALSGKTVLKIAPGLSSKAILTYKNALQEDGNNSKVAVTLTAGDRVTLGGNSIKDKSFRMTDLTLVPANAPAQSGSPFSVDFVGRRTVLNDGLTLNSFTFALTNMTQTGLALTPEVEGGVLSPTVFTVWFDAAPNQPDQPYPWALAKVQDLASQDVVLKVPSTDWSASTDLARAQIVPGNPQWTLTVKKSVVLGPQDPVLFTFSGIRTDLDPGVTRMYLRYENLPGFLDGILIGELEKSSLLYGITRGNGLYLSAGTSKGNTPPVPNFNSGLYVEQFNDTAPAATFKGGGGLNIASTGGKIWNISSEDAGKLLIQESGAGPNIVTLQRDGIEVGSFGTNQDQHIAINAGSKTNSGIKLRAGGIL